MSIQRVALIFDDRLRPDTTGVYVLAALAELVDVSHFRPDQADAIPTSGFDLYLSIDDDTEHRLPVSSSPRAYWTIDTHRNFAARFERSAACDLVFAAQRDGAERLRAAGIDSATWLPLACDPDVHRKQDVAKRYDVAFVGHRGPGPRHDLLELIRQQFADHFIGRAFFEDMARTYSSSRIVFNRSIGNDVNMRVFEAAACGSLLVTNDLSENGQAELFQDGVHLVTYREPGEMLEKMRYYLRHADPREAIAIAAAGRAEALAHHTYRHRMERLLIEAETRLGRRSASVAWEDADRRPAQPALASEENGGAPRTAIGQPPSPQPSPRRGEDDGPAPPRQGPRSCEVDPLTSPLLVERSAGRLMRGLTSIIVPCWNQLEFTRHCLRALFQHTTPAWELIVVDNGSTDGTGDFLAGVQVGGRVPVTTIHNTRNRGFPAAINQGLRAARGEYLVLLNNDAVVTDGWLKHLIALTSAPVGMVAEHAETGAERESLGNGRDAGDRQARE